MKTLHGETDMITVKDERDDSDLVLKVVKEEPSEPSGVKFIVADEQSRGESEPATIDAHNTEQVGFRTCLIQRFLLFSKNTTS